LYIPAFILPQNTIFFKKKESARIVSTGLSSKYFPSFQGEAFADFGTKNIGMIQAQTAPTIPPIKNPISGRPQAYPMAEPMAQ
jgi:hypothetical protein